MRACGSSSQMMLSPLTRTCKILIHKWIRKSCGPIRCASTKQRWGGSSVAKGQNENVDVFEDSYAAGFTRELNLLESGLAEVGTTSCQPPTRIPLVQPSSSRSYSKQAEKFTSCSDGTECILLGAVQEKAPSGLDLWRFKLLDFRRCSSSIL